MPSLLKQMKEEKSKGGRMFALIRHFETPMNDENKARGWLPTPIDPSEYEDAYDLGEELRGEIDYIVASDLLRTLQTAHYVSLGSKAPIIKITPFLHTWNIGKYTGEPTKKVDPILEKLAVQDPDKNIDNGESFNQFKYRFLLGVISTLNECEGTIAFVTHGRNLAVMNAWREENYNDDLDVSDDHLGYEEFGPGTATFFNINSPLLKTHVLP